MLKGKEIFSTSTNTHTTACFCEIKFNFVYLIVAFEILGSVELSVWPMLFTPESDNSKNVVALSL
jgi:hypothetical protein